MDSLSLKVRALAERLAAVNQGFELESLNGVVCSIPDSGIGTPTHRTWCARCKARYKELRKIEAELLEALLVSGGRPEKEEEDSERHTRTASTRVTPAPGATAGKN